MCLCLSLQAVFLGHHAVFSSLHLCKSEQSLRPNTDRCPSSLVPLAPCCVGHSILSKLSASGASLSPSVWALPSTAKALSAFKVFPRYS